MKKIFALLAVLVCLCNSCTTKPKSLGLSFAGITIGEMFPDSLKGSYEFLDYDIPQYEGTIVFNLPNHHIPNLNVVAATDLQDKEVILIQIGAMYLEQAEDFYEMLKSKYGLPISSYGNTDVTLSRFIDNIFENLGYDYYVNDIDVSGDRVLAEWNSVKGNSDILMIGETFHFPEKYSIDDRNKPRTFITFKYIDKNKWYSTIRQSKENKRNKTREEYRQNNSEYMNQDF